MSVWLLVGCRSAKVTSEREFAPPSAVKPAEVYVTDFELGAETIEHEDGLLAGRPGPAGRMGKRLSGTSEDPAVRARKLVDLMADSIVKELVNLELTAERLPAGVPLPTKGWLVRGVFVEVQEGNRMTRAMIGFGMGKTKLQVMGKLDDLSLGPPKPLYELVTEATSGSRPGAVPTIVFLPYGAAVRYVMAGKDPEKDVKGTASLIATHIAARVTGAGPKP